MALIEIYQGETKRIDLSVTDDNGTPFNLSGYSLYYSVKRSYSETGAVISLVVTGHDSPVGGLTHIDLSSQNTNQCAGEYVAAFALVSSGSGVSIFNTEGLRILPSPYTFI